MGVNAYGCVCIRVCMHIDFVCMHVCKLYVCVELLDFEVINIVFCVTFQPVFAFASTAHQLHVHMEYCVHWNVE